MSEAAKNSRACAKIEVNGEVPEAQASETHLFGTEDLEQLLGEEGRVAVVLADVADELLAKIRSRPVEDNKKVRTAYSRGEVRFNAHASLSPKLLPMRQHPRSRPHPLLDLPQVLELAALQPAHPALLLVAVLIVLVAAACGFEFFHRRVDLACNGFGLGARGVEAGGKGLVFVVRVVRGGASSSLLGETWLGGSIVPAVVSRFSSRKRRRGKKAAKRTRLPLSRHQHPRRLRGQTRRPRHRRLPGRGQTRRRTRLRLRPALRGRHRQRGRWGGRSGGQSDAFTRFTRVNGTHERAFSSPLASASLISSSSSVHPSSAFMPSMSSSSDSHSTPSVAFSFCSALPLPLAALPLPLALASPPSLAFLARLAALGPGPAARSPLASAASLRLPLRSGAPGWALPPPANGSGSACFVRAWRPCGKPAGQLLVGQRVCVSVYGPCQARWARWVVGLRG